MSNGIDLITLALARKGGGVTPEELTEALATKQNKLTAGTNVTIQNNVISSNQPTAINPYVLSFGNEDYNGSAPKLITAEKIGAATEDFVNSSIATNTAYFKGTFNSLAELEAISETEEVSNNDYGFVKGTDAAGNTTYTRYKYNADDEEWMEEYVLNNSSFTADEWATIQSGLKDTDKTQIATNTSAIANIVANMPDSPEDVNAQAKALIIKASLDEGTYDITITDERYVEEHSGGISINYEQLFADSVIAFTNETDVIFRATIDTAEGTQIVDFVCVCLAEDGTGILFEGHLLSELIVIWLDTTGIAVAEVYDVEPSDSIDDADDSQLTTAGAQKEYFQTKITSSNKIPYSNISGTPTIPDAQVNSDWNATSGKAQILNKPTIPAAQQQTNWNSTSGITSIANKPSNFVLGYSGTTSTASALKIVTCSQAQYDASSKASDTIYLIKS